MSDLGNDWVGENLKLVDFIEELDWKSGEFGVQTGFKYLDTITNGLQNGFIVIGGHPAAGKSTFMTQLALQALDLNPNLYWICFSIDDSKKFQINRMAAMSAEMNLNDVRYPSNKTEEVVRQRKQGYNKLRQLRHRWRVYDQADEKDGIPGNNIDLIFDRVIEDYERFRDHLGDRPDLLVTVDAFQNTEATYSPLVGGDERTMESYIATRLKDGVHLTTKDKDPVLPIIITSAHIRKNDNTRPTLEDLRGVITTSYLADLVVFCYNEYEVKGEASNAFIKDVNEEKMGVVEIDIRKSKLSHKKGKFLCTLDFNKTKLVEMTERIEVERHLSKIDI